MNHGTGECRGDEYPVEDASRRFQIKIMWIAIFQLSHMFILKYGETSVYISVRP